MEDSLLLKNTSEILLSSQNLDNIKNKNNIQSIAATNSVSFNDKNIKESANIILAFFQNMFKIENKEEPNNEEIKTKSTFVSFSFENLFKDELFKSVLNKYCVEEEFHKKFLIETLNELEKQCLGSYYENEEGEPFMEIDVSTYKISNEILSMFDQLKTTKVISYIDIYNRININFSSFYSNQYLKFILDILVNDYKLIYDANTNSYSNEI